MKNKIRKGPESAVDCCIDASVANAEIMTIINMNQNAIPIPSQIKPYTSRAGILRRQALKLALMAATGFISSNMTKAGASQNIME